MTPIRSSNEPKPREAKGTPRKPAQSRRAKKPKCKMLSDRLHERLDEFALDIPYAAQFARKLRPNPEEVTLGDVIIDIVCMQAVQGNATLLRSLWERIEGTPPGPEQADENEPRCIRTPLPVPPLPPKARQ